MIVKVEKIYRDFLFIYIYFSYFEEEGGGPEIEPPYLH